MTFAEVINDIEFVNYELRLLTSMKYVFIPVLGMILCSFLLYCLLFRTKQDLGTYRYLQIIMVIVDTTYTTGNMFIRERVISADGVFGMFGTTPYVKDKFVLCAYVALYAITFVLIDYGFLFRMWAIKSPWRIRLFSHPFFIFLLIFVALLQGVTWFANVYYLYLPTESGRIRLREVALLEYGIDTMTHVMVMGDYYNEDWSPSVSHLVGVGLSFTVIVFCFSYIVYATSTIIYQLKVAKLISKNTIRLQRQLFTIIPLISLYSSCGIMMVLPIFRVNSQWMAHLTPLLVSFFLPLDAIAVIFSMTDYRREVFRLIRLFTCHKPAYVQNVDRNSTTMF